MACSLPAGQSYDSYWLCLADPLMEGHSPRSVNILNQEFEDLQKEKNRPTFQQGAGVQGYAPIAIFLEHGGTTVIKQATATLVRHAYDDPKEVTPEDKEDEETLSKDEKQDLQKAKQRLQFMREVVVFPASCIKVPVPGHEDIFFRPRAVVMFGQNSQGRLDSSWLLGRLPTVDYMYDRYLLEGVHYCICPGFNSKKPERKHNDFAVISINSKTHLRCFDPAGFGQNVMHCFEILKLSESTEGKPEYEAFAAAVSKLPEYLVVGYTMVKVDDSIVWEEHVRDLANGVHPLYQRQLLVVPLKARHAWECQTDVNPWNLPKEYRQYEKPPKRLFPSFKVFWRNFRLFPKHHRRSQKFYWNTEPVLERNPIPVDWDLLLAQDVLPRGRSAMRAKIVESLNSGAVNGGPWLFTRSDGTHSLIGMHLGGPSVDASNPTEGTGGLYVALALQHRVVEVLSSLLVEMSMEVEYIEAGAERKLFEAKMKRAERSSGKQASRAIVI